VVGFGSLDGKGSEIARLLNACAANSGNLGAAWLAMLAAMPADEWVAAAELRDTFRGLYLEGETAAGARSRVADAYALLGLAERLLVAEFGFTDYGKRGRPSFFAGTEDADHAPDAIDTAADAMAAEVAAWIAGNPDAFPTAQAVSDVATREPTARYGPRLGVRVVDPEGRPLETWINPRALKDLFTKHRKSHRTVMREWDRQGRIVCTTELGKWRTDPSRQIGQNRARMVVWLPLE